MTWNTLVAFTADVLVLVLACSEEDAPLQWPVLFVTRELQPIKRNYNLSVDREPDGVEQNE